MELYMDLSEANRLMARAGLSGIEPADLLTVAVTRLANWRTWVQFIYLNGGPPTDTDGAMQLRLCHAHDEQVSEEKSKAVGWEKTAGMYKRQMELVTQKIRVVEDRLRSIERGDVEDDYDTSPEEDLGGIPVFKPNGAGGFVRWQDIKRILEEFFPVEKPE